MSEPAGGPRFLTVDEYRALEATSQLRHEYVRGAVRAMTGVSRRHIRIMLNIARRLMDAADSGCRVYVNDLRVRVDEDVFYYPDVVVSCEEPDDSHEEAAPCFVVEVLSPSTEATDRHEKAVYYARKPGLQSFLLVHQHDRRVERYHRDDDGAWRRDDITGSGEVTVPCPATILTLDEIYDGVEREGGEPWPRPRRVREPEAQV